jgi:hypothetical protein
MGLFHFAGITPAPSVKPDTISKPLNVLFFGANLFLGEWRFDKSLERQRVKAFHVRHHTLAGDGTIDLTQIASGRVDSPNPGSAIHRQASRAAMARLIARRIPVTLV